MSENAQLLKKPSKQKHISFRVEFRKKSRRLIRHQIIILLHIGPRSPILFIPKVLTNLCEVWTVVGTVFHTLNLTDIMNVVKYVFEATFTVSNIFLQLSPITALSDLVLSGPEPMLDSIARSVVGIAFHVIVESP
jgi:hypothetical protein